MTKQVPGIAVLVPFFDGFVVDQWGVLHDGTRAYPGALDALERLRAAGKRVVILSNSGRRSAGNVELMESIGFPRRLWDDLVSAGEDAFRALRTENPGTSCYLFGEKGRLAGLDLRLVDEVDDAELLLAYGIEASDLASYDTVLRPAAARHLPMVCANPDLWRFAPDGSLLPAPGALADRYEAMGGIVRRHGKPHGHIFETALSSLAVARARVLCIGDSLHHDVLGAARVGIGSALVAGGVHREALGDPPDLPTLGSLAAEAGAAPDYLLRTFRW